MQEAAPALCMLTLLYSARSSVSFSFRCPLNRCFFTLSGSEVIPCHVFSAFTAAASLPAPLPPIAPQLAAACPRPTNCCLPPTPPYPTPLCRRAADVLGLGSYSQRQLFDIYAEYQLMCYVDPGWAVVWCGVVGWRALHCAVLC